jgi:hypothetical protein
MRSYYPVSSQEELNELQSIQEALLDLIGYDDNAFDNKLDRQGSWDTQELALDKSILDCVNARLYNQAPSYAFFYKRDLISQLARRAINV